MASVEQISPEALTSTPDSRRSQSSSSQMRIDDSISTIRSYAPSSLSAKLGLGNLGRRTLGLGLLMLTVFLWTLSNFLASSIFSDRSYNKPFFVVYVNTSMFALSLIPLAIQYVVKNGVTGTKMDIQELWGRRSSISDRRLPLKTQDDERREDDVAAGERLLAPSTEDDEDGDIPDLGLSTGITTPEQLSLRETAWLSLEFCMLWFLANYFASACLEYTSVGSVTILTSTSSVWTLVFCAVMRVETFTIRKLIGVLASLTGVILISTVDLTGGSDENRGNFPQKSRAEIAIGDSMAFFSAIVYGMYVTVMKRRVGNEERVNMQLFFGLVGLFNVCLTWPIFFLLHFTGIEPFEMPPTGRIWMIILTNSVSSFVSDISWAFALLLTTPLVTTVGLSLTIPLSLIGEMIQYAQFSSWIYWVGAAIVLLSFLFINQESEDSDETTRSTHSLDVA